MQERIFSGFGLVGFLGGKVRVEVGWVGCGVLKLRSINDCAKRTDIRCWVVNVTQRCCGIYSVETLKLLCEKKKGVQLSWILDIVWLISLALGFFRLRSHCPRFDLDGFLSLPSTMSITLVY